MAEVGAVASIAGLISLGLQLGECAVKLKRFCDQVEKAPEALRTLEIEIKLFSLLLQDVEAFRVRRAIAPSPSLLQCIYHCQIVTAKIVSYVRDIEAISKKYKLPGRVYAALRLSDVNALCKDMERTKTNLIIALQLLSLGSPALSIGASSTTATQLLSIGHPGRPDNESDLLGTCSEEQDDDTELDVDHQQATPVNICQTRKFASSKRVFRLEVCLPWMLGQAVWGFAVWRSYSGWEMSLQCDNLVPWESPVFYYAEKGDTEAVQALFREGKASPRDCRVDVYGSVEPLHLANRHTMLSTEMYATILSYIPARDRALTAEVIAGARTHPWYLYTNDVPGQNGLATLGYFHEVDLAQLDRDITCYFAMTNMPLLQQNLVDFSHHWTGTDWFNCFSDDTNGLRGGGYSFYDAANLLRVCSQGNGIEGLMSLRNVKGETVLHFIAETIGSFLGQNLIEGDYKEWPRLFTSIIDTECGSTMLHDISSESNELHKRTAFITFLESSVGLHRHEKALCVWQKLLDGTIIDIGRFLEQEIGSWKTLGYSFDFKCRFDPAIRLSAVYQDAQTGTLQAKYVALVQCYQHRQTTPGAWPISMYMPETINWSPRFGHAERDEEMWIEVGPPRKIAIKDPWLMEIYGDSGGSRRAWSWWPQRTSGFTSRAIYDDSEVPVILNSRKAHPLRRMRSEPRSLVQAYNERSRTLAGGLIYCSQHTRWNLQNNMECHWQWRDCDDERCCNCGHRDQPNWQDFDRVLDLGRLIQTFTRMHGVCPSKCGSESYDHATPWSVAGEVHLDFLTVSGISILAFAMEKRANSPLCEQFPDCNHQKIYLEALRRRKEDAEQGTEVVLDRSWWPLELQ